MSSSPAPSSSAAATTAAAPPPPPSSPPVPVGGGGGRRRGRLSARRRLSARWELEEVVDRGGGLQRPLHLPAWPLGAVADRLFARSTASVATEDPLSAKAWSKHPFPHEEMGVENLFDRVSDPETTATGAMMVMVLPSDLQDDKLEECVKQMVGDIKKHEMEMLRNKGVVFLREAYRTTYCVCRYLAALELELIELLTSPGKKRDQHVSAYILPIEICAEPAERPRPPAEQLVALVEKDSGDSGPEPKRARIVQLAALDASITGRLNTPTDLRSVPDPCSALSPLRSAFEINEVKLEKELKNLMRHYPALHPHHPVPVLLVPSGIDMQRQQHFVPVRSFKVMNALGDEHNVLCEDRDVLPPVELVLRNFVPASALWLAVPTNPDKAWNGFSLRQASASVAALWANELTAASILWAEMHSEACLGLDRSDVWATKTELMKVVTDRFPLNTPTDELQAAWFVLDNVLKRHVVNYAQTVALQARRQKRPAPDAPIIKVPDFMPGVVLRPCDLPLPCVPGIDLVRRPEQLLAPAFQLLHIMRQEHMKRGGPSPPTPLARVQTCVDAVLKESVPQMLDREFESLRDALGFEGPPDDEDEDGGGKKCDNDDDGGSSIAWSVDECCGVHLSH